MFVIESKETMSMSNSVQMYSKIINNYRMRLSMILKIIKAEVCVTNHERE
jgi:hypothetical protein